MNKTKPTIRMSDIANVAGVSPATVCRILNKKGNVSDDVQKRVNKVIEEMGYLPQPKRERIKAKPWIAVLNTLPIKIFETEVLTAVQEKALELDYLASGLQLHQSMDKSIEIFKQLKMHKLAGIISTGLFFEPNEWIRIQKDLNTPIVLLNTQVSHPDIAYLLVDFEQTISSAINHLIQLGHTRIAYLGDHSNQFSNALINGVIKALLQKDIQYPQEFKISIPHTAEGASQAVNYIMMLPAEKRPTAIIAFCDEFAIFLMHALRYKDLNIPKDISIIGFDNDPLSAYTYPSLTTIDIPKYKIGRNLIALLEQLIKKDSADFVGHMIVNGSLVVRNSTGPVRNSL